MPNRSVNLNQGKQEHRVMIPFRTFRKVSAIQDR